MYRNNTKEKHNTRSINRELDIKVGLRCIYADCGFEERVDLWEKLREIAWEEQGPWLCLGD